MKVLILKLGALGDVLMATPLIQTLTAHYKIHELWLLTSPPFADLFTAWPDLRVHVVPRRGWRANLAAVRWLRVQRFARVYDLQSNDRTRYWCALAGARERIGNHPYFPYTCHPATRYTGQCHAFERLNEVLVTAGHAPSAAKPWLPITPEVSREVAAWLAQRKLSAKNFVLLHAGASARHPAKRWPHYQALGQALVARGLEVVWIGAAEDADLNATLARTLGIDATSCFGVTALAALARHARFAVTNDSAPMHILACADIPVFGLFGPTDWRRTHALGQRERIITLDDAPSRAECPPPARELARITPAFVLERIGAEGLL